MRVQCAWCKRWFPDKPPFESEEVSHTICDPCAKKIKGPTVKRNPLKEADFMKAKGWALIAGTRAQPKVFLRTIGNTLSQMIQREARAWRLLQKSFIGQELVSVGEFPLLSDASIVADKEVQKLKPNPGAAWHRKKAGEAHTMDVQAQRKGKKMLSDFFHGKEIAHTESALAASAMKMNPTKKPKPEWYYDAGSRSYILDLGAGAYTIRPTGSGFRYTFIIGDEVQYIRDADEIESAMDAIDHTQGRKFKRPKGIYGSIRSNPLAVFSLANPAPISHKTALKYAKKLAEHEQAGIKGNPPGHISANVEGVIYHRCLEIRAEKTGWKPGLYRHPFERRSGVQVLALDNGDILIHSSKGKRLWKEAT